jgi:lipoate-protein ligase A
MVQNQPSKDEQIGFHKGAISTLMKEREEMMKILTIVEQLIQMHVKALKSLGVDVVAQSQKKPTDKLDELIKK